jgi:hypothetical protein
MSTMAWTFLLHPVYDHAPNALVPPPSTAAGTSTMTSGGIQQDGMDQKGWRHYTPPPWQQLLSTLSLSMTAAAARGPMIDILCPMLPKDGPRTKMRPS